MKRDFRRSMTHGVSPHPAYGPVYWAKVEIVEANLPKRVVKTINVDSRISEYDAAERAIAAADAWIAAHEEQDGMEMQDWRSISKDAVLEAVCQCSHDAQGNTASWECIASKLAISFPKHVYSLCEELEEQGLVLRVARFIRLTEMGTAHCKARLIASEGSVDEEPPIAGKVWDL